MSRTLVEKFRDPDADPFGGDYSAVNLVHRVRDAAPTAEALFAQVGTAASRHLVCYVGLYQDPNFLPGRTRSIYAVQKFTAALGQSTPWTNRTFGFTGDVDDGELPTTIELDHTMFTITGDTVVPATPERMDELLAAEPGADSLNELLATEAGTRIIRVRNNVLVPARYIPLVINRRLTPRQFWTEVVGAIRDAGDEAACEALINWSMVAIMEEGGVPPSVTHQAEPKVPLLDKILRDQRRALLWEQLPDLQTGLAAATTAAGHEQLAGLVGQLVAEQQLSRQETRIRAEASQAPRSPSKHWGEEACRHLCILCEVASEDMLPPVWAAIAATPKKDRQAIEFEVARTARAIRQAGYAPLVTPELAKKVGAIRFDGDSLDDLSDGLQPFALLIPDNTTTAAAGAMADANSRILDYDTISSTSTSTSLADAKALRGAGKAALVKDYPTMRALLIAQHILLRTLLGTQHSLVAALEAFVSSYSNQELFYQGRMHSVLTWSQGHSGGHGPALLLRAVQLRLANYFRRFRTLGATPAAPNFLALLDELDTGNAAWVPVLPANYKQALGGQPVSGGNKKSGGSTGSSGSTVSDLTASTAPSSTEPRRVTVTNPNLNSLFDEYRPLIQAAKLNDAIEKAGHPPRVTRDEKEVPMCLSYHLRGTCFTNCPRRGDHGPHKPEEDEALNAWCKAAYK